MSDAPSPKWLLSLLRISEKKKWCTKIYCSTCGAMPFRRELKKHIVAAPREEVVSAILAVTDDEAATLDAEKTYWALGMIFYEVGIFSPGDRAYANMPPELAGTWAEAFFIRIQPQIDAHNRRKGYPSGVEAARPSFASGRDTMVEPVEGAER